MITPELIAEMRAALEAATPEPDAELVCLLRNHASALLDEIERLRAELRDTRTTAEFFKARVAELEARPKQCRWHITNEDEYSGVYTTECGHMFSFDEGDRAENGAVYCQYCGGKIVEDAP